MDLATIETSPEEAKAKLDEYRAALRHDHTVEDEALAQAYRAVARGLTVIRLSEAVTAGGFFPNGLPRIAIVRADARECFVDVNRWSRAGDVTFTFGSERRARNLGALVNAKTVRVTVPLPAVEGREAWAGRTTVPLIPPRHRPKRPRLSRCHLLWEVEAWDPTPPVDPALIRHLRGTSPSSSEQSCQVGRGERRCQPDRRAGLEPARVQPVLASKVRRDPVPTRRPRGRGLLLLRCRHRLGHLHADRPDDSRSSQAQGQRVVTEPDIVMLVVLGMVLVVLVTVGLLAIAGHRRDSRR